MSTKLKLMGVDVASFGNAFADEKGAKPIVFEDPFKGTYKKLLFDAEGTELLGGILVGDASEYSTLAVLAKSDQALPVAPGELLLDKKSSAGADLLMSMPAEAQVCSCNNVSKDRICSAIRDQKLASVDEVKKCTKAGAGCGGCLPLVIDLFKAELKKAGQTVSSALCEHFAYTRQELFQIVKTKGIKSFNALLDTSGPSCAARTECPAKNSACCFATSPSLRGGGFAS
jgi:nitrite reductase (NADH) large subunit